MPMRTLNPKTLQHNEDWEGNNAAFLCPHCGKVFIVSEMIHKGKRSCPNCGKSTGSIKGGKGSGGSAELEW